MMSHHQQCLPLPPRRRRRRRGGGNDRDGGKQRRRGQEHSHDAQTHTDADQSHDDNNDNENGGETTAELVETNNTTIDSLANMDAMEYLQSVSEQAKRLPDIFTSSPKSNTQKKKKITTTKRKNQNHKMQENHSDSESFVPIDGTAAAVHVLTNNLHSMSTMDLHLPSPHHLPSHAEVWISKTMTEFSNLRHSMQLLEGEKKSERLIKVPPMKDESGWHLFCLGREESMGNAGGYYDDGDEDNKDQDENNVKDHTNDPPYDYNKDGNLPTVSLLLQMDQVMTRRVLHHHVSWLVDEAYALTQHRAQWLYGLLARLDKPLHAEEQAMLRRLLRCCCKLRTEVKIGGDEEKENEGLAMLNVLITVVGLYFEQGPYAMRVA